MLVGGLLLAGCANSRGTQEDGRAPLEVPTLTEGQQELLGGAAPDFRLDNLEGASVGLEDLRGKVVILDFWATWCSPCRKTMPILHAVAGAFNDSQVVLHSINEGEDADLIEPYLENLEFKPSVLLDSDMEVADRYRLEGLPYTVILDSSGAVQAIYTGYFPNMETVLRHEVEKLVGGI